MDLCIDIDMRIEMRIDMCIDQCMDICADMCIAHPDQSAVHVSGMKSGTHAHTDTSVCMYTHA